LIFRSVAMEVPFKLRQMPPQLLLKSEKTKKNNVDMVHSSISFIILFRSTKSTLKYFVVMIEKNMEDGY